MQFLGSGQSGTFDWLFQRVSGAALVIMLFLHFILIHYVSGGPITYEKVAYRLANPYYKAWELLFLVLGLYHAMNGVKILIDDYVHQEGLRILLTSILWLAALALLIFGSVTVLTFSYQAS